MSKNIVEVLELAAEQSGLLTTQQAQRRGVSRLTLSRLAEQGAIERVSHGVYATPEGAVGAHAELRAVWLSLDPHKFAFERLVGDPAGFIVTHRSAAELWGIGQLIPDKLEFVSTARKRTRREDVRLRRRAITIDDITVVDGLPCTTIERTVADLVEAHEDLSLVADVLGDSQFGSVDFDRLRTLLDPLASRNGHDNGSDFVQSLMTGSSQLERSVIASMLTGPLKPLMESIRPHLPHLAFSSPSSLIFEKTTANIMENAKSALRSRASEAPLPSMQPPPGVAAGVRVPGGALSSVLPKADTHRFAQRDEKKAIPRPGSHSREKSTEVGTDG